MCKKIPFQWKKAVHEGKCLSSHLWMRQRCGSTGSDCLASRKLSVQTLVMPRKKERKKERKGGRKEGRKKGREGGRKEGRRNACSDGTYITIYVPKQHSVPHKNVQLLPVHEKRKTSQSMELTFLRTQLIDSIKRREFKKVR
jgi:hypothetical protein